MKRYFLFTTFILFCAFNILAEDSENKSKIMQNKEQIMAQSLEELRQNNITNNAPKVGEKLPDGDLLNLSEETSLYQLIGDRPAIVTFYRGEWCPYCNLQLQEYTKHIDQIESLGATLIAISPELPESSAVTIKKGDLKFSVLSDINNKYATKLGIVYSVNQDLKNLYGEFGIDLQKNQGNDSWKLPLTATYVVDKDKIIKYSFIDVDYKKRADIEDLIKAIKELN